MGKLTFSWVKLETPINSYWYRIIDSYTKAYCVAIIKIIISHKCSIAKAILIWGIPASTAIIKENSFHAKVSCDRELKFCVEHECLACTKRVSSFFGIISEIELRANLTELESTHSCGATNVE